MFSLTFDADNGGTLSVSATQGGPAYISGTEDPCTSLTADELRVFAQMLESFADTVLRPPFGDLQ